eukprot:scaffold1923_cov160-Amphora_coffeaeformis.AAC.12
MRQLDQFSTKWADKATALRRRFQREIEKIISSKSNQQKSALAFDVLHDDNDDETNTNNQTKNDPFASILVAVDLPAAFMTRPNPSKPGFNMKAVVGYHKLLSKLPPASCTVYGAGLDYQSAFEKNLAARTLCAIHTFDCTLTAPEKLYYFLKHQFKTLKQAQKYWHNGSYRPNMAYHPWCVGDPSTLLTAQARISNKDTNTAAVSNKQYDVAAVHTSNTFTLDAIMQRLGHASSAIDLLKFDIEGYEWQLFGMLLDDKLTEPATLPQQISFELHTQGARRKYVPKHTVRGRDSRAVKQLFRQLWKLGYRVVYKEINGGDAACAEFGYRAVPNKPVKFHYCVDDSLGLMDGKSDYKRTATKSNKRSLGVVFLSEILDK